MQILFLLIPTVNASAEEEKEVLTHIASSDVYFSGHMIAVGDEADWEEKQEYILDNLSYLVAHNDADGEALLTVTDLDWSPVDILTPGIYTVSVSLEVSEEDALYYVLDPSLQMISIPVCISDPAAFELFPARSTEIHHMIYFLPDIPSEETQIYGYFSDEACTMETLKACDWTLCDSSIACMKSGGFTISREAIGQSRYGYFYLQYGDLQSQILEVYENGVYTSVTGMGGDRDGGDANMIDLPAVTQPAPVIPGEETTAAETTEYLETTVQADGTEKAPEAVPSDIQTAAQKVKSSASSGTGISSGSSFVVTKETVPSATVQTTATTTIASTT
ncbi:MAG: hypothetical protein ACI4JQ_02260 [Ruminococcus sp.]